VPAFGRPPAARTNVRPSPAAATPLNSVCGLGGATVPSKAPVAGAPAPARPGGTGAGTAPKDGGTLAKQGPVPAGWRRIAPEMASDATITPTTAAAATSGASHPDQRRGLVARRTRPGARPLLPTARTARSTASALGA